MLKDRTLTLKLEKKPVVAEGTEESKSEGRSFEEKVAIAINLVEVALLKGFACYMVYVVVDRRYRVRVAKAQNPWQQ